MLLITVALYCLAATLYLVARILSQPKAEFCRALAGRLVNSLCFSLVVFCLPNFITAYCVEGHEGGSLAWSEVLLAVSVILIVLALAFLISNREQTLEIGSFLEKDSRLAAYAPIVFLCRLVIMTILLFAYFFGENVVIVFILLLQVLYMCYLVVSRPYRKRIDFFRSFGLELGLLFFLVTDFVLVKGINDSVSTDDNVYLVLAATQYAFLIVGLLFSGASLIAHLREEISSTKVLPSDSEE